MKLGIFSKKKKEGKRPDTTPEEFKDVGVEATGELPASTASTALLGEHGVLKGFYVSEKASGLVSFNQYVFKVFDSATKNEVKKQVERSFGVKVKGVKVVNLPRKSRTVGRHKGFKQGVKKAIVVLEKGYTIDSAKA